MAVRTNMRVIYKPEGGSRREWTIDLQNPAWDIHKMAPKAAGIRGWAPFSEALEDIDADAWQALIWVLRKREEPQLQYASVTFPNGLMAELDFGVQCPDCDEWVSTEDDTEHACPGPPSEAQDDDDAEPAGDGDPEA